MKILATLADNPKTTIDEISTLINKSPSAVGRAIRKLKEQGKLDRIGPDKGGYWEVLVKNKRNK